MAAAADDELDGLTARHVQTTCGICLLAWFSIFCCLSFFMVSLRVSKDADTGLNGARPDATSSSSVAWLSVLSVVTVHFQRERKEPAREASVGNNRRGLRRCEEGTVQSGAPTTEKLPFVSWYRDILFCPERKEVSA